MQNSLLPIHRSATTKSANTATAQGASASASASASGGRSNYEHRGRTIRNRRTGTSNSTSNNSSNSSSNRRRRGTMHSLSLDKTGGASAEVITPAGSLSQTQSQSSSANSRTSENIELRPLTMVNSEDTDESDLGFDHFVDQEILKLSREEQSYLHDFFFPPAIPRSCQLLRLENIAIPMCYFMVGLLQGLSGPFINAYPRDIHASEAQQTMVSAVRSLPASFKLFFGFLSDTVPFCGKRRKSYMVIGWCMASAAMLWLSMTSDLSFEQFDDDGHPIPPAEAPPIPKLASSLLLFGTGFWMADVMGDSLVAEKAKLEPVHARGNTQSTCYSYRFFGSMIASPFSTILYKTMGAPAIVFLLTMLPLCTLPFIWFLQESTVVVASANNTAHDRSPLAAEDNEPPHHKHTIPSVRQQCTEIWNTVCSRAVWQPLAFVYIYNVLQVGNGAWREFLVTGLGFTSFQLNILLNVSLVLLYVGVVTYKYYFIKWSWRTIYIACTMLNGFLSFLQLLLIEGTTFGIPPFWFALGDDVFAEFIAGIQFLPTTIMMVHLCPTGSEGASYAMFTTVNNSALTLSSAISANLLNIWDVSKTTIQQGDYVGMTNLTILTTVLQLSGILFVCCLPHTKDELMNLKHDSRSSKIGGFVFLFVTFGSILYSIRVGVLTILYPGSLGES